MRLGVSCASCICHDSCVWNVVAAAGVEFVGDNHVVHDQEAVLAVAVGGARVGGGDEVLVVPGDDARAHLGVEKIMCTLVSRRPKML